MIPRQQLKHQVWLAVAREQARLGTCRRLQVGCVLLRGDGSVAGTGYNGTLPGRPHCQPEDCGPGQRCWRTRHAERSALDYSLGEVATCYVTHEPCVSCLKDLLARGCRAIYYIEGYQAQDPAENQAKARLVVEAGIVWCHMYQNGQPAAQYYFLKDSQMHTLFSVVRKQTDKSVSFVQEGRTRVVFPPDRSLPWPKSLVEAYFATAARTEVPPAAEPDAS